MSTSAIALYTTIYMVNEGTAFPTYLLSFYVTATVLYQHYQDTECTGHNRASLDWQSRVKVANGAARGFRYLHEAGLGALYRETCDPITFLSLMTSNHWYIIFTLSEKRIEKQSSPRQ